jgi:hypothetical protein
MKKILILVLLLITGIAQAQVTPTELMGLGMPPALSSKVASIGNGSRVRAAAGTAALPSYSFSTDTNTGMYSFGADEIGMSIGGVGELLLRANELMPATPGGLSLGTSNTPWNNINMAGVILGSNGTASSPTYQASADLNTGIYFPAADSVGITTGGTLKWTADSTGQLIGAGTATIGWTVQSAANQACSTTCVTPCVFGQETTSKAILACSDATADSCLCAGAS